jgi:CRP-like cAMP-binding protein
VAILKDQPRSTSAISVNRCELLSLDKNEFLHLISYGNSAVNGNSIDEEDKRFNEIISKYIGENMCP